ncbi:MAG: hypothetical protein MJZ86_05470 [Bacteroidales bacterium]|nr:hypothetical protein [Bacteroidales bacterium]
MDNKDYLIFHNMTPQRSEEKQYETLYQELLEKCHPNNFMQPYDKEKVDTANTIFAKLQSNPYATDFELKELRLLAVQGLRIHISTQKLYEYLMQYCDPQLYTSRVPYDAELVNQANAFYSQILDNKDDIFELEKIELIAKPLIDRENERKQQIEREREESERQKKLKEEEEYKKIQIQADLEYKADIKRFYIALAITIITLTIIVIITEL